MGEGSALWQRRRPIRPNPVLASPNKALSCRVCLSSFFFLIEAMADCVSVICSSGNYVMLVAVHTHMDSNTEVSGWPADSE